VAFAFSTLNHLFCKTLQKLANFAIGVFRTISNNTKGENSHCNPANVAKTRQNSAQGEVWRSEFFSGFGFFSTRLPMLRPAIDNLELSWMVRIIGNARTKYAQAVALDAFIRFRHLLYLVCLLYDARLQGIYFYLFL
jgi:hypothetical protein